MVKVKDGVVVKGEDKVVKEVEAELFQHNSV